MLLRLVARRRFRRRFRVAALAFWLAAAAGLAAAQPSGQIAPAGDALIPDVPTLMAQVRAHQRAMDAIQENYTFRETDLTQILNKNGSVRKTESETYEVFFVNTHQVQELVEKDGKPLDPDQQKKEQGRTMKQIRKDQQTPPGQAPPGEVVVSVSHILAMARVSRPRLVLLDGRPTFAFDFTGDPHAKAHGIAEEAARKMSGTIWIDEKDREVRRIAARLDENFHVGFGMVSLSKGSNLVFDQKLVNNELWLPTSAALYLNAHAFGIFGARAEVRMTDSDYKKFSAKAIQQPGAAVVPSTPH
jgi:hypothetical protein